jgi:hypothetical protein
MNAKSTSTTESPVIKQLTENPITKPITTYSRIQTTITITPKPSQITNTLPISTIITASPTQKPTQLTLLSTSTFIYTGTPTEHVGSNTQPLSDAVISINDIISTNNREWGTFIDAYNGGYFTASDMTSELERQCIYDCVKIVWNAPFPDRNSSSSRQLTIILFRTSSPEKAQDAIDSLYQEINNNSNPEQGDYTPYLSHYQLPEGSKALWNNYFIVMTHRGSVVVVLMSDLKNVRDVSNPGEIQQLAEIAELQLEKLRNLGFPP